MRTVNILSYGVGIQSTTILLMALRGELGELDAAIFADPGEESEGTYRHLAWTIRECEGRIPVIIRSVGGRLGDHLKNGVHSSGSRFASIPAFTLLPNGKRGITRRQCTREYKVDVVERAIRRDVLGLAPRQRIPRDVKVRQWLGLSYDEPKRVANVRARMVDRGFEPYFPLFERGMTRGDCVDWLRAYGVPNEVPRSACVFCPYRQDAEWQVMKDTDPKAWDRAVEIDVALRTPGNVVNRNMEAEMFIHRSLKPLAEVDFLARIKDDQLKMSFGDECEGMCGS